MRGISVLIKPSSSLCNINCSYCFYKDISKNREQESYGFMTLETLENLVKKSLEFSENGVCNFIFQGGEPTLVGLAFFEKFIEFQKKYVRGNTMINNSIQTNGTLIDEKWAKFLKMNNFLVGISLDGNKKLHDRRRVNNLNEGTFEDVIRGKKYLDEHQVDYNILTVMDDYIAENIAEVYNFYRDMDIQFQQYIPCLNSIDTTLEEKQKLSNKNYLDAMKKLFDLWYQDIIQNKIISIRYFENILLLLLNGRAESCDMMGHCSVQNVIEADGSVYPCDFYVIDRWKLGNINTNNFQEIFNMKKSEEFVQESLIFSEKCDACKWRKICRNGCKRYRDKNGTHIYCEEIKEFLEYSIERFIELANLIKNKNR